MCTDIVGLRDDDEFCAAQYDIEIHLGVFTIADGRNIANGVVLEKPTAEHRFEQPLVHVLIEWTGRSNVPGHPSRRESRVAHCRWSAGPVEPDQQEVFQMTIARWYDCMRRLRQRPSTAITLSATSVWDRATSIACK